MDYDMDVVMKCYEHISGFLQIDGYIVIYIKYELMERLTRYFFHGLFTHLSGSCGTLSLVFRDFNWFWCVRTFCICMQICTCVFVIIV